MQREVERSLRGTLRNFTKQHANPSLDLHLATQT